MRFDHVTKSQAAPQFAFKEARKETPDFSQIMYIIPFSFGLGVLFLAAGGLICLGGKLPFGYALIAAGSLMFLCPIFLIIYFLVEELYMHREIIEGHELPEIQEQQPEKQVTHFELRKGPAEQNFRIGEIEVEPQLLIDWCNAAMNQQSLAYTAWERRFALPDGRMGRERYQEFRRQLIKEGFAKEVGGNVGLKILWRNPDALRFIGCFAETDVSEGNPLLEG